MNNLLKSIIISLSLSTAVYAEESTAITFNDLPLTVQSSALKHLLRSSITRVELIKDNGFTEYEIESKNKGINKDVSFAANGMVLEIEQSLSFSQLPDAVQKAINSKYPNIKIKSLEKVQEFSFDVEGAVDGKPIEIKILASGDIKDEQTNNKD